MYLELRDSGGRPLIEQCALVGLWDQKLSDEYMVLAVEPTRFGQPLTDTGLRNRLRVVVGAASEPDAILFFKALPVTGRQRKIDKHQLRLVVARRLAAQLPHLMAYPPGQEHVR